MDDVVETLRALGIEEEAIERALERGDPEAAIFDSVLLPEMAERTVSAAEIERRGGLEVGETIDMFTAFGLPPPAPDQPAFSPDEARVFVELKRLEEVWPRDIAVQISRVYGRLLARIAQTELQLFRVYVEPRLRAEGRDRAGALHAVRETFAQLLPLADTLLTAVHRRWVEHEMAQEAVTSAETGISGSGLPGAVEVTFLFCDLKDFTAFADSQGDTAAVLAIDRFAETVTRERGEDFRFMKGLGDGVMLVYGEASSAVGAGARIVDGMRAPRMPGVHASAHSGVAIVREGDYFGGSVNLAARLLNAADRDELIATSPVVEQAGDEFEWEDAGTRRIRGFAELVDVYRLELGYS